MLRFLDRSKCLPGWWSTLIWGSPASTLPPASSSSWKCSTGWTPCKTPLFHSNLSQHPKSPRRADMPRPPGCAPSCWFWCNSKSDCRGWSGSTAPKKSAPRKPRNFSLRLKWSWSLKSRGWYPQWRSCSCTRLCWSRLWWVWACFRPPDWSTGKVPGPFPLASPPWRPRTRSSWTG